MDYEFEWEKPFIITTADILEIAASGGNGSEYVDIVGLMENAAKELREKDAKIERLREEVKSQSGALQGAIGAIQIKFGELAKLDKDKEDLAEALRAATGEIKRLQKAQVPERERWLHSNPEALASVKRGIADAEAGKVHDLGDFSQYLENEQVKNNEIERLREALRLERQLKDYALRAFNEARSALQQKESE